uniref:Uncharacterized protein n=1 Tax=Escherichia coli TaxID=562 RepID=A0A7L9EXK2_ECOLX|nr:hypothetical protein [Escherichia coli]
MQLHQQKGMISLSPPTICNSASEQTPLAAPPGASCKKTHRAASSTPNIK